jgi:D-glycero-alpha-D-manno-heptose-7-phosphate kinase
MIITRTPFRISFFGGGTDYPDWYREHGGAVISSTINKYCFITVRHLPQFFEYKHRIRYFKREEVRDLEDIQHPSVRECLRFTDLHDGVEIVHSADLPAQSGLGSSSTFTVSLLHALYTLKHYMPTKRELALNAIDIEQNHIGEHVGSQDQAAAAFGGLNYIRFGGSAHIDVQPLVISPERLQNLNRRLLLFFTGFARNASSIAEKQIEKLRSRELEMFEMLELTERAKKVLTNDDDTLDEFGRLLHEHWLIKRTVTEHISSDPIDRIYERGRTAGAVGGKLLGAGGGGFMLFFVHPEQQESVRQALSDLLHVPFRFESSGSQVVYYSHGDA